MLDLDGNFKFSNTVELSRGEGRVEISKIYPNPFEDAVTIALNSPGNGLADIEIYDLSGRKVRAFKAVSTAGNIIALQGLDLPSGGYMLRLMVGTETITRKLVRR